MTVQRVSKVGAGSKDGRSVPGIRASSPVTSSQPSQQAPRNSKENGQSQGQNQQQGGKPEASTLRVRPTLDSYDKYDEWTGSLILRMVPDSSMLDYGKAPWAALLGVKCQDVPRLMREGFFWSVDNILLEEGYMFHDSTPGPWEAKGFRHVRQWNLADKSNDNGATPKWVGWLQVMSPSIELITRFRVQDLSPDQVCSANAYNIGANLIYNYNCRVSGQNYNCIYDDKPLEGWWPWPKKEGEGGSRVFLPPAPGVNWEDELFPRLPLARRRRRAAAPAAPVIGTYDDAMYMYPSSTAGVSSNSGCVIL